MASLQTTTLAIARVCSSSDFTKSDLADRISRYVCDKKKQRWVGYLARFLASKFGKSSRPDEREIIREILEYEPFCRAFEKGKVSISPSISENKTVMRPAFGEPEKWSVPAATSVAGLAEILGVHHDDLGWLTIPWQKAKHYHYRWHKKRGSQTRRRLIEIPKPLLKSAQQAILAKILETVPPHEAACGFLKGSSVFDFVTPHTGQDMVLKMDLKDFFPSIGSGRVFRLFFAMGYPENIARMLSRLCTNAVDNEFLRAAGLSFLERQVFRNPHLPQGAPSSPALANLCAFRLDCRLAGLARSVGANYTRYADDLLFSGDRTFARRAERVHVAALRIVLSEGFQINPRKTRFMRKSQRQRAAGLVLNEKPNVSRAEFDQLKAILTNCQRHGWRSQNVNGHPEFRAHLRGRIEWLNCANPSRGEKLKRIFDAVDWES